MQKYLEKALTVLEKYELIPEADEGLELVGMLEQIRQIDEAKVLAIARTFRHMGAFNELVRKTVENTEVGSRYAKITEMFDSIREDSKALLEQLDDGAIDIKEKVQNVWMRLSRGTPHARFEKIKELYLEVCKDTQEQLAREDEVLDAYIDFRFAIKEAEVLAQELYAAQAQRCEEVKGSLTEAKAAIDAAGEQSAAEQSALQLRRDELLQKEIEEDKSYQLLKDIVENLGIAYSVGETLIAKLRQTHDCKDQVYRRAVTFFTTNEHVFTVLDAVYTSQHGLHEATQTTEALKDGVNKSLEDVADLGRELERAALKAGYGSTIREESVKKLVSAIADYQIESRQLIAQLREESTANAEAIARVVEEGKARYQAVITQ